MGLVTLTQISNGEDADATTVDSNFDAIAAELNGGIENVNIDAAAGITAGKLLPVRVATTVPGIGGSSGGGAHAQLRVGSSPYEFIGLVYDATAGAWVTPARRIISAWSSSSPFTTTSTTYTSLTITELANVKDAYDAGLRPEFRVILSGFRCAGGSTASLGLRLYEWTDGDAGGSLIVASEFAVMTTTATSGTQRDGGWVQPTLSPAPTENGCQVYVAGKTNNAANALTVTGIAVDLRWVGV